MKLIENVVFAVVSLLTVTFFGCVGSSDNVTYPTLNDDTSYCFEYTWLGPEYDNTTSYDGTCDDFRDESRLPDSVPCSSPLVISYDGTIPDSNWLYNNHRASVLCRKAENQECVTYTFWDNGLVLNQTHMCARIRSTSSNTPYGCYKQDDSGYEIELCICQGGIGLANPPCNSGALKYGVTLLIVVISVVITSWQNIY